MGTPRVRTRGPDHGSAPRECGLRDGAGNAPSGTPPAPLVEGKPASSTWPGPCALSRPPAQQAGEGAAPGRKKTGTGGRGRARHTHAHNHTHAPATRRTGGTPEKTATRDRAHTGPTPATPRRRQKGIAGQAAHVQHTQPGPTPATPGIPGRQRGKAEHTTQAHTNCGTENGSQSTDTHREEGGKATSKNPTSGARRARARKTTKKK